MKRIAVVSAILEQPGEVQHQFNEVVSAHQSIVRGRLGLPFVEENIGVIALAVVGTMDEINAFTGTLGKLPHVIVKTAVSKRELEG